MEKYKPPFDITSKMLDLTSQIMENLGRLSNVNELEKLPRLRKVSRVKSIHSSLAIENNTLSVKQVTDVINGKKVLGPKDEITAVKNAFLAYKELDIINPYNINDLLKVHGIMMNDLVDKAGYIRSSDVGVLDGNGNIIHAAPPVSIVHELIGQLFNWVKNNETQMLIRSSIFHYEFEFIHPFKDGNGRMGRLWQTALLSNWKPIFKYIPIESVIKDNQEEYYKAIQTSTNEGKSNAFIIFMLEVINIAIQDIVNDSHEHYSHLNIQINKLMQVMEVYPQSTKQLMERLNLKSRVSFRQNYLLPALEAGLIAMTNPENPTNRNQMYYKVQ